MRSERKEKRKDIPIWLWCWERLKAGGEGDDRGWDGWMASWTQRTWVWVNFGSWWWTGRSGMLQSMGSQRIRHDWVTELNWTHLNAEFQRIARRDVKDLKDSDNHDGVNTHLEPDILECEVKWALRRKASLWTKLVEVMEFQLSYFKSWKMMLWKCFTQYASKLGKLSSGHSSGKSFSSSHVWMWVLDHKKAERLRIDAFELLNWCFWIFLEKILESPLDCKEIKSVNSKGNQSWIFIGRIMLKLKL